MIGIAAFIWIFIKLPQEWWIHVAQNDFTDFMKETVFGVDGPTVVGGRVRQPTVRAAGDHRGDRRDRGRRPASAQAAPPGRLAVRRRRRPADAARSRSPGGERHVPSMQWPILEKLGAHRARSRASSRTCSGSRCRGVADRRRHDPARRGQRRDQPRCWPRRGIEWSSIARRVRRARRGQHGAARPGSPRSSASTG